MYILSLGSYNGSRGFLCGQAVDAPKGGMELDKEDFKDMLTEREKKLIELIHSMEYGEVNIFVQQGQPVRVEEVKRSIKL